MWFATLFPMSHKPNCRCVIGQQASDAVTALENQTNYLPFCLVPKGRGAQNRPPYKDRGPPPMRPVTHLPPNSHGFLRLMASTSGPQATRARPPLRRPAHHFCTQRPIIAAHEAFSLALSLRDYNFFFFFFFFFFGWEGSHIGLPTHGRLDPERYLIPAPGIRIVAESSDLYVYPPKPRPAKAVKGVSAPHRWRHISQGDMGAAAAAAEARHSTKWTYTSNSATPVVRLPWHILEDISTQLEHCRNLASLPGRDPPQAAAVKQQTTKIGGMGSASPGLSNPKHRISGSARCRHSLLSAPLAYGAWAPRTFPAPLSYSLIYIRINRHRTICR